MHPSPSSSLIILQGHSNTVFSVAFSPDGKSLVSGSYDHTVKVWNLSDGTCTSTLEVSELMHASPHVIMMIIIHLPAFIFNKLDI
jgi:WD40 repeat protein